MKKKDSKKLQIKKNSVLFLIRRFVQAAFYGEAITDPPFCSSIVENEQQKKIPWYF
jgi:hypothetical protein